MLIELHGMAFGNKGAHLMLLSVLDFFSSNSKDVEFTIRPTGDYTERASLELYQRFVLPRLPENISDTIGNIIPHRLRRRFGICVDNEIDVILDGAGFNYSDQWGYEKTERMAQRYKRMKKKGKKIILLPQAFGPFNQKRTRIAFQLLSQNVDLMFVRDEESYNHIISVIGNNKKVCMAPDFTNLLPGKRPEWFNPNGRFAAIIPNVRMLDKISEKARNLYLTFLKHSIELTKANKINPVIIIFQRGDEKVVENILKNTDDQITVIQQKDPLELKWFIRQAFFLVGSRFHALICALSQGVPSIGMGWSHKYSGLFKDYGMQDFLFNENNYSKKKLHERISALLDEKKKTPIIDKLKVSNVLQKKRTEEMWQKVFQEIGL
jgi:polysaccharide pyruvyl transferase WcaK-like protein